MWLLATHLESWSGRLLYTHVARRNNFLMLSQRMNKGRSKWHPIWKPTTGEMQSIYVCSTLTNHGIGVFLKSRPVVLSVTLPYVPSTQQENFRMPSSPVSQQDTKGYQGNLKSFEKHRNISFPSFRTTFTTVGSRRLKINRTGLENWKVYEFKDLNHWMILNVL